MKVQIASLSLLAIALSASAFPPEVSLHNFLFAAPARSFLGINVAEIDAERAKALKLKEVTGVEITRVEDDTPAARAGLRVGDVILEYNGQRVEGTEQMIRLVRETPPGRDVRLIISRNGQMMTLTARTEARKPFSGRAGDAAIIAPFRFPETPWVDLHIYRGTPRPIMNWRSKMLGIEAEPLEGQLAEFFGVKEGVLVRSVMKDSPAEKAGLRAGDVIVKVDGAAVSSPNELLKTLPPARDRRSAVNLTVVRNRQELSLTVNLDSSPAGNPSARPLASSPQ
jgi:serine protease Do